MDLTNRHVHFALVLDGCSLEANVIIMRSANMGGDLEILADRPRFLATSSWHAKVLGHKREW